LNSFAPSGAKHPSTIWFLPSFFPYGKILIVSQINDNNHVLVFVPLRTQSLVWWKKLAINLLFLGG
jgi:hypothetical protein